MDNAELFAQLKNLPLPPTLQRDLDALIHRIDHPMADILSRVPGDTLSARAKKLKVSRQTMYVWMAERFRPTLAQAKRIAKVTGEPIENILPNGAKGHARKVKSANSRKPAHKKAKGMEARRVASSRGHGKAKARRKSVGRRRIPHAQRGSGHVQAVHSGTGE